MCDSWIYAKYASTILANPDILHRAIMFTKRHGWVIQE